MNRQNQRLKLIKISVDNLLKAIGSDLDSMLTTSPDLPEDVKLVEGYIAPEVIEIPQPDRTVEQKVVEKGKVVRDKKGKAKTEKVKVPTAPLREETFYLNLIVGSKKFPVVPTYNSPKDLKQIELS